MQSVCSFVECRSEGLEYLQATQGEKLKHRFCGDFVPHQCSLEYARQAFAQ